MTWTNCLCTNSYWSKIPLPSTNLIKVSLVKFFDWAKMPLLHIQNGLINMNKSNWTEGFCYI